MVWINDRRIRDAQVALLKVGLPTKVQILNATSFAMLIQLKALVKTIKEVSSNQVTVRLASKNVKGTPHMIMLIKGDLHGLTLENIKYGIGKLKKKGFNTSFDLDTEKDLLVIDIDLSPIILVFTARGIPRNRFSAEVKIINNVPVLVLIFRR